MGLIYVYDLDGTLCTEDGDFDSFLSNEDWHTYYENCAPMKGNIEKLRKLFATGNRIIIHTARKSQDLGVTKRWLEQHRVPFHELILDKPKADFYVDTNCRRPEEL